MNKLCLIFNPTAGQARAGTFLEEIKSFTAAHPTIDLKQTQGPGDAEKWAREAMMDHYDVVAAAGGDGTVNEVINGLMVGTLNKTDRPCLAIIPIGSANDLARGLGLASDLKESLGRIRNGRAKAIDVGHIYDCTGRSRYFGFSVGFGYVGAVASERFLIHHVHGPWLYLWASIRALRYYEPNAPLHIWLGNDQIHSQNLMSLSINNVGTVGGFPLTPGAELDDGLFDVLSVRYAGRARRIWLLLLAWTGRHLRASEFELVRSNRLEIVSKKPVPIHVDGEIYNGCQNGQSHLKIEMMPKALRVLT